MLAVCLLDSEVALGQYDCGKAKKEPQVLNLFMGFSCSLKGTGVSCQL